jgi:hypothetical protein
VPDRRSDVVGLLTKSAVTVRNRQVVVRTGPAVRILVTGMDLERLLVMVDRALDMWIARSIF